LNSNTHRYRSRLLGWICYVAGALPLAAFVAFFIWQQNHFGQSAGDPGISFSGGLKFFLWLSGFWLLHQGFRGVLFAEHRWNALESSLIQVFSKGLRGESQLENRITKGPAARIVGCVFLLIAGSLLTWLVSWTILPAFGDPPPNETYMEAGQRKDDSFVGPALLSLYLAGIAFTYGRRLSSKSAEEVLAEDKRPPVLYFRSFMDDAQISVIERLGSLLARTQEERFVKKLKRIGPVIAIGNPNEQVPLSGAARCYSSHEEWQVVAHDLLSRAALVVYRAGSTPGFIWEISRGRAHLASNQMLILVPDPDEYPAFRKAIAQVFPLPELKEMGPIITFDAAWNPVSLGRWNSQVSTTENLEMELESFVIRKFGK
jgi:hypothetical protein